MVLPVCSVESWAAFTVHVPRPFASTHKQARTLGSRCEPPAPPVVPVRGHGPIPIPVPPPSRVQFQSSTLASTRPAAYAARRTGGRDSMRDSEAIARRYYASQSRAGPTQAHRNQYWSFSCEIIRCNFDLFYITLT